MLSTPGMPRNSTLHGATWKPFANAVADVLDKPKGLYMSSFRCMSALVVRAVTRYRGPYPYVDGLMMQVTQRITVSKFAISRGPRAIELHLRSGWLDCG